ncbi:MAG: hypothetical protein HW380_3246 [Magnetococcales bacterium]|nr:hypothetical protein [Magnetococcales bacterium]
MIGIVLMVAGSVGCRHFHVEPSSRLQFFIKTRQSKHGGKTVFEGMATPDQMEGLIVKIEKGKVHFSDIQAFFLTGSALRPQGDTDGLDSVPGKFFHGHTVAAADIKHPVIGSEHAGCYQFGDYFLGDGDVRFAGRLGIDVGANLCEKGIEGMVWGHGCPYGSYTRVIQRFGAGFRHGLAATGRLPRRRRQESLRWPRH